jgi:hypothetical protein
MIVATHGIVASQILTVPVATAATSVGDSSFTANWNAYSGAVYYLLDVSLNSSFSSYVLQDKVVYSTSYSVTGLASNTTYYYRVRASTEYDTDAQAFFDRVTTAGGSLSTTEKNAVNTLVLDLKGYSIWTPMKAIYPMVGASAAACAQNLKSSSFTGTFSGGWTYASTGAKPNGTSGYMDSALNMSTQLSQNNVHISVYLRTNITSATVSIGATGAGANNGVYIYPKLVGNSAYFSAFNSSNGNSAGSVISSLGLFVASRLNSTTEQFFQNTSKTSNTYNSSVPASRNIIIAALNNNGTISEYDSRENAFASIGEGLTDTEESNLYTAVNSFQVSLSRNV